MHGPPVRLPLTREAMRVMENHTADILPWLWWLGVPLLFVLLVLYIFRPGAKRRYRKDARIPFEEERDDRD
jgi:cbb3-type cytochrome oxidase subunit 3